MEVDPTIDWTDPACHITPHFTVKDAIYLHAWSRLATLEDGLDSEMQATIIATCQKAEEVRQALGCPMNLHCMLRTQAYNRAQGIKPEADVHSFGIAWDYDCAPHLSCDEVKTKLMPELERLNIRMENNGLGARWVHNDLRSPGPSGRFFSV